MDPLTRVKDVSKSIKTGDTIKIFVVDDDPVYRNAIEYRLRQHAEYRIYSFKTGEECFRHFKLLDPDIVILDYFLNGTDANAKNGLEILKTLKNLKPDISIVMLSGKESLEVATNSIKFGAFDYIVKNEGTFIRLQNLINKILNRINLEKWTKRQANHVKIIAVVTPIVVLTPVLSKFFIPEMAPEITIVLFVLVVFFFIITHKLEKDEWTTLSENMRSNE